MTTDEARTLLKQALSKGKRTREIERGRAGLHGLVRPFGRVYKTKGAQGWDVMTEAMLGDTPMTGAK